MDYLTLIDADTHPLLEPRSPAYTHATVRRAFIVWLRCGQKNQFRDFCNYYHYLEAMENQLPADSRASSRHHEFSLFVSNPPTSPYQQQLFPDLYSSSYLDHTPVHLQNYQILAEPVMAEETKDVLPAKIEKKILDPQEIFDASQVFKAPVSAFDKAAQVNANLFKNLTRKDKTQSTKQKTKDDKLNGTSKQEIVETSEMIKNYCKEQQVPLKNFLENFKEYTTRCQLSNTVNNVSFYIKRKMVQSELTLAVMVHKAKSSRAKKMSPKAAELKTNDHLIQTQANILTMFSKLNVEDKNLVKTVSSFDSEAKIKNLLSDDYSFDDKGGITEKTIKLLRREDGLKCNVGFSSSHNIVKLETQKCRKI